MGPLMSFEYSAPVRIAACSIVPKFLASLLGGGAVAPEEGPQGAPPQPPHVEALEHDGRPPHLALQPPERLLGLVVAAGGGQQGSDEEQREQDYHRFIQEVHFRVISLIGVLYSFRAYLWCWPFFH